MDKISVIVPVYNMETRLEKCLMSLIEQKKNGKFRFNIILVDDGSTDTSPLICDAYRAKYPSTIYVIHKKNEGVSEARNVGIRHADGEYIAFIDPDDYVMPFYLYNLFTALKNTDADISCCRFFENWSTENTPYISHNNSLKHLEVLTSDIALRRLFYQEGLDFAVWGKLIRKDLFDNLLFLRGKRYEDVLVTYKLISKSKKVTLIQNQDYIYWQRKNGMSNSSFNKAKLDVIPIFNELYSLVHKNQPKLNRAVACRYFTGMSNVYFQIPDGHKEKQDIWDRMVSVRGEILLDRNAPFKVKIGVLCTFLGQRLMEEIYIKTQIRGKTLND